MISNNQYFIRNPDGTLEATAAGKRFCDSWVETSNEMQQLIKDQVMGESSWGTPGGLSEDNKFEPFQSSENFNDQWQFLSNSGADGEQAAKYLEQMLTEKRTAIDKYLADYEAMTIELSSIVKLENLQGIDLDTILTNLKENRPSAENADGSLLPESDLLAEFAAKYEQQLTDLQQQSDGLYKLPKHLSNWLDQNHIDRPIAVDKLVEKSQYIGLNGTADRSDKLDAISDKMGTAKSSWITDPEEFYTSMIMLTGDLDFAVQQSARTLMREDDRETLRTYLQLSQPLADAFNDGIATQLTPRFTFQDIIDNIREGRDVSAVYTQEGHQKHPQSSQIEAFFEGQTKELLHIAQLQENFEQKVSVSEWLKNPYNADRAYAKVEDVYGIGRWETGELSRGARRGTRIFAQDTFRADSTYYLKGEQLDSTQWKKHLQTEAVKIEKQLITLLDNSQGFTPNPLTLEQLVENFKQGKPLGLMKDGKLHPFSDQIEAAFANEKLQLADHIDAQWLRESLPQEKLNNGEEAEEFINSVMDMILESRKVWTFDELLNINKPTKNEDKNDIKTNAEIEPLIKQLTI